MRNCTAEEVLPADLAEHRAVKAWSRLEPERIEPAPSEQEAAPYVIKGEAVAVIGHLTGVRAEDAKRSVGDPVKTPEGI